MLVANVVANGVSKIVDVADLPVLYFFPEDPGLGLIFTSVVVGPVVANARLYEATQLN